MRTDVTRRRLGESESELHDSRGRLVKDRFGLRSRFSYRRRVLYYIILYYITKSVVEIIFNKLRLPLNK